MSNTQFNALWLSLSDDGITYPVAVGQTTIRSLSDKGYINIDRQVTFVGLLEMLASVIKSNRSYNVKRQEITRISACISAYNI